MAFRNASRRRRAPSWWGMGRDVRRQGNGAVRKATLRWAAWCLAATLLAKPSAGAFEPCKPVEFIIPAGLGGGADQMARFLQRTITKHHLLEQPMIVLNKPANGGSEGFQYIRQSEGNPHKIVMTLSNLFTTPLATGMSFSYRDLTPVAMLALDQFVLWVNADSPYKTAQQYLAAIRSARDGTLKMGGTGAKQEDQLITVALGKAIGKKLEYVQFKGGGEVATELVAGRVDSTVNNPVEAVDHWKSGKLRPLCVFSRERMPQKKKVTEGLSWNDIPTCKESGLDVSYHMLRGVFLPGDASPRAVAFYVELFRRIRALPEWSEFVENGGFQDSFASGKEYADWLHAADCEHRILMQEAGFLPK